MTVSEGAGGCEALDEGHRESADSETGAASGMSAMHVLGMVPADHGGGGGEHGGGHHALHLIYHLQ